MRFDNADVVNDKPLRKGTGRIVGRSVANRGSGAGCLRRCDSPPPPHLPSHCVKEGSQRPPFRVQSLLFTPGWAAKRPLHHAGLLAIVAAMLRLESATSQTMRDREHNSFGRSRFPFRSKEYADPASVDYGLVQKQIRFSGFHPESVDRKSVRAALIASRAPMRRKVRKVSFYEHSNQCISR